MSLSAWLRIGWLALAADFAYWMFWRGGSARRRGAAYLWVACDSKQVLYFGGWVLFLVLLVLSYLLWRVNERERMRT